MPFRSTHDPEDEYTYIPKRVPGLGLPLRDGEGDREATLIEERKALREVRKADQKVIAALRKEVQILERRVMGARDDIALAAAKDAFESTAEPTEPRKKKLGRPKGGKNRARMASQPLQLPPIINVEQLARYLGLSESSARAHCRESRVPAKRVGGQWLVSREALLKFLEGEVTP